MKNPQLQLQITLPLDVREALLSHGWIEAEAHHGVGAGAALTAAGDQDLVCLTTGECVTIAYVLSDLGLEEVRSSPELVILHSILWRLVDILPALDSERR